MHKFPTLITLFQLRERGRLYFPRSLRHISNCSLNVPDPLPALFIALQKTVEDACPSPTERGYGREPKPALEHLSVKVNIYRLVITDRSLQTALQHHHHQTSIDRSMALATGGAVGLVSFPFSPQNTRSTISRTHSKGGQCVVSVTSAVSCFRMREPVVVLDVGGLSPRFLKFVVMPTPQTTPGGLMTSKNKRRLKPDERSKRKSLLFFASGDKRRTSPFGCPGGL